MLQQVSLITTLPASFYVMFQITSLPQDKLVSGFALTAFNMPFFGLFIPIATIRSLIRRALAVNPDDAPGARLERILKLPRLLEVCITANYAVGTLIYLWWLAYLAQTSYFTALWGTAVLTAMVMLVMIWTRIFIERIFMPYALEESLRQPDVLLKGGGFLWPVQRWYLPYSFSLFILCTLITMGTVIFSAFSSKYEELMVVLDQAAANMLRQSVTSFVDAIWLPLLLLGLFMLGSASLSALLLAWHQHQGFRAIQEAIEGFVGGSPKQPEWVTTDELGELARATARAFNKVREFSLSLRETAATLGDSASRIEQSNVAQNEVITRQAAALQEAQVTAQEIRQTSVVAAQKAEGVLQQTQAMEELGRDGEAAIARSIASLQEIREQVTNMATRIKLLGEHTRQIENITRTVKDLADQSNMLALNAAIEAVRSGDHGKGFGVVAREIRSLADQSIQATSRVRQILQDIGLSIRSTVEMTEQGVNRVNASVEQVRAFGDSMRRLSSITQENTSAVRQISAAVNQQNVGVNQIFQAINDLSTIMNEAMARLNETSTVTVDVRGVASHVSTLISNYGWEKAVWKRAQ